MSIRQDIKDFIKNKNLKFAYTSNDNSNEKVNRVLYSGPYFDSEEIVSAIETILEGKWMSAGENVYNFERQFSKKFKQKSGLMVNSGSSANLILITAIKKYFKWNDNDEIIVSPVGFPTTIAPIVQNNLKPIFIDIEMDTLNFNIDLIYKKFTKNTRAIFVSPVLGNSIDFYKLINIVNDYNSKNTTNIQIILDNCDSLGSKYNNKYLNEYAFASSYSFYPAHHITTFEGGMITSNDEEFIKLCRSFSWWGRDCHCVGSANLLPNGTCGNRFNTWLPDTDCVVDHRYIFNNMGYNLKPLDLQGSIGIEQLKKFDIIHEKRRENKKIIQNIFETILGDDIYIPNDLENSETSWFGVPIIVKDSGNISARENKRYIVDFLEKNKIQTRNCFAGNILLHPGYNYLDDYKKYPNANKVLTEVFFVGCHPSYNERTFEYIKNVLTNWKIGNNK